jgi:hypothetical protein
MIYLLNTKDEAFSAYKKYEKLLETQFGVRIKCLYSDRGGEYLSKEFMAHLKAAGMTQNLTVHNTPEHNGVAERLNCTLLEKVRAMLHTKDLPKNLWGMAVRHAVWLKNRTPTKVRDKVFVPYERWHCKKLNLKGLREFGSAVWVNDDEGKLDGCGIEGIWLRFDVESSGSHIYWPNRSVTVKRSFKYKPLTEEPTLAGVRNEGESGDGIPSTSSSKGVENSKKSTCQLPSTTTVDPTRSGSPIPTPTPRSSSPNPSQSIDPLGDSFQSPPPDSGRSKRQRTKT